MLGHPTGGVAELLSRLEDPEAVRVGRGRVALALQPREEPQAGPRFRGGGGGRSGSGHGSVLTLFRAAVLPRHGTAATGVPWIPDATGRSPPGTVAGDLLSGIDGRAARPTTCLLPADGPAARPDSDAVERGRRPCRATAACRSRPPRVPVLLESRSSATTGIRRHRAGAPSTRPATDQPVARAGRAIRAPPPRGRLPPRRTCRPTRVDGQRPSLRRRRPLPRVPARRPSVECAEHRVQFAAPRGEPVVVPGS